MFKINDLISFPHSIESIDSQKRIEVMNKEIKSTRYDDV